MESYLINTLMWPAQYVKVDKILFGILIAIISIEIAGAWEKKMITARMNSSNYSGRHLEYREDEKIAEIVKYIGIIYGGAIGALIPVLSIDWFVFMAVLVIAETFTLCDWKYRLIPNDTALAMFGLGVFYLIYMALTQTTHPWILVLLHLGSILLYGGMFAIPALFGTPVGGGDIKIICAVSILFGPLYTAYSIVLLGLLMVIIKTFKSKGFAVSYLAEKAPFGPYLALAMMIVKIGTLAIGLPACIVD